jgi:hypothetical protein
MTREVEESIGSVGREPPLDVDHYLPTARFYPYQKPAGSNVEKRTIVRVEERRRALRDNGGECSNKRQSCR